MFTQGEETVLKILIFCFAAQAQAQDANRNFTVIPADEWSEHDKALGWVNELTPNQTIALTVVYDPANENVAYFATSAPQGNDSLLSLYRYNTQTQLFERLWRKEVASGEDGLEWQVLGVDNGRVVFIEQPADTPETCIQPVISGYDKSNDSSLWSVPSDNLYVDPNTQALRWKSEPTTYVPPQEVLDEASAKQAVCEESQQPQ